MIVDVPFVGPAYESASKIISAQESLNILPEINPQSTRPMSFISRPGRELFVKIGGIPRAMFEISGTPYAVVGSTCYRINANKTTTALTGSIAGTDRMGEADDGDRALICSALGSYQLTQTPSLSLTEVTSGGLPYGSKVAYYNGYWLKPVIGTKEWRASAIDDPGNWPGTNNGFERQISGWLSGIVADHAEVLLFKTGGVGFWFESGAASGIPFDKIPQLVIETGSVAGDSIVGRLDERVFYLGQQKNSTPMVFAIEGRQARKISTHAVDLQFSKYTNPQDAYGMQLVFDGHPIYVLTFPNQGTWAYDASSQEWHQWSYSSNADYDITHMVYAYDQPLGLNRSGHVYALSTSLYQDAGEEIFRRRVTAPLEAEGRIFTVDSVELECEVGECATEPVVMLEMSRDGGSHWSNRRSKSIGGAGDRLKRVRWTGLGATRDAVFRVSMTDNCRAVWRALRADIRVGVN